MSFVKRVVNLGRGLKRTWSRTRPPADEGLDADEDAQEYEPATERRIELLDKLRDEGLLNSEEYRAKRASVLGLELPPEDSTAPPPQRKL